MNLIPKRKLSNEELNIRVAELLGPTSMWMTEGDGSYGMPNWCENLNAMHGAEQTITRDQQFLYHRLLIDPDNTRKSAISTMEWHRITATARQRAEAFVLTMEAS